MSTLVDYQANYYRVTTSLKYIKQIKEVIKQSFTKTADISVVKY